MRTSRQWLRLYSLDGDHLPRSLLFSPTIISLLPRRLFYHPACGFIYHNNPHGLAVSLRSCLFLFTHSPQRCRTSFPGGSAGDGHRVAVAGSVEDCRSGAKWPLNGSQARTGFIDALARRQQASPLSVWVHVRVSGFSLLIAMLITKNSP